MQLYFKKYGDSGQPIVILHGLFGMSDNWHNIARKLSETYVVYTIDQRNHGQSAHSSKMNFSLMADDVWETMESQNIDSAILIGHSMGGKTAMKFVDKYPSKISKLVVIDIAPKAYPAGHQIYFDALKSINFNAESRKEIEEQLAKQITNYGELLFLLKNLYRKEEGGFGLKVNVEGIEHNYSEIIAPLEFNHLITTPTCFISGALSKYIRLEDEEDIKKQFSNVCFRSVPEAGHWVHADNPTLFLDELLNFLTSQ